MAPVKGPSMRWDDANKLQLLLLILGQNSNLTCDADKIAQSWDGNVKPTPRAVRNTFTDLRNQASRSAGGKAPSTPGLRKSGASTGSRATKTKRKADAEDDDQEKARADSKDAHILNPTQFKKRLIANTSHSNKRTKTSSDDEPELSSTSTTEAENDHQVTPSTTERRSSARKSNTPARYIQVDGGNDNSDEEQGIADGEGEDGDDDDQDFDLDAHHRKERGQEGAKGRKGSSWADLEI